MKLKEKIEPSGIDNVLIKTKTMIFEDDVLRTNSGDELVLNGTYTETYKLYLFSKYEHNMFEVMVGLCEHNGKLYVETMGSSSVHSDITTYSDYKLYNSIKSMPTFKRDVVFNGSIQFGSNTLNLFNCVNDNHLISFEDYKIILCGLIENL